MALVFLFNNVLKFSSQNQAIINDSTVVVMSKLNDY